MGPEMVPFWQGPIVRNISNSKGFDAFWSSKGGPFRVPLSALRIWEMLRNLINPLAKILEMSSRQPRNDQKLFLQKGESAKKVSLEVD